MSSVRHIRDADWGVSDDGTVGDRREQKPALMFAFKGSDAIICFRSGGKGRLGGAHSRRQDPKTPVEHALMRGLVTA